MITIKIGTSEQSFQNADENWINQQINGRRRDGQSVCVRVVINESSINMALSTPNCAGGGGGGRPPTSRSSESSISGRSKGLISRISTAET
jgi:hypothetical protein